MDFEDQLALIARRWWVIALSAALGLTAGLVLHLVSTPSYTSSTQILILPASDQSEEELASATQAAVALSPSLAGLAKSSRIVDPALATVEDQSGDQPVDVAPAISASVDPNQVIVRVDVTLPDAERAAAVANAVAQEFVKQSAELLPNTTEGEPLLRAEVISVAAPPSSPSSTGWPFVVGAGFLGGGTVGLILILLLDIGQSVRRKLQMPELTNSRN